MAKNIEKTYNDIFKLRDSLDDIMEKAQAIVSDSKDFSGIINKVLTEQLTKYFIPSIRALKDNVKTPGSLTGLVKFLDAVPLAYTRDKEVTSPVDPMIPENADIEAPAGSNIDDSVDNIPQNTSYAKPEGDSVPQARSKSMEPVQESQERKCYKVIRKSTILPTIGDRNRRDNVVFESLFKEEAENKATYLNTTVLPEEKDLLGTEYIVKEV